MNAAAFDVTLAGLVMTSAPEPLALSLAGLYAVETARLPAWVKLTVCVGPFPLGSFQW